MVSFLDQLTHWISMHSGLAGGVVFMVAFSEALAVVGLVVPGAVLMVWTGSLIATGALSFWPTMAWAVAGAVLGDGLSYWIGLHFHERLNSIWPFYRYPKRIEQGRMFINRHGGKSIFLGRFVGPIRPIVPVVAGMLDMPAVRFVIFNILSALIWAPAYLLPGMALGASLALASEVAGRFAVLLVLILIMVWLSFRIPLTIYRYLRPRAGGWSKRMLIWGEDHPVAGYLVKGLTDPEKPASPVLVVIAGLLLASLWLFFGVTEDVLTQDPLVQASRNLFYFFQNLRTPWGDGIMVACTQFGDAMVTVPVVLAVCIWLSWRRAWHSLAYLVTAVSFGAVVVQGMKYLFHVPRPEQLYSGISAYSFPSGHATMSMVIYGFLAVLASHQPALLRRWLPFALAGLLITIIGFSRLYLGAHWLFDVVGGYSIGMAWVAFLAISYKRHGLPRRSLSGISMVILPVMAIFSIWHINNNMATDLEKYAPSHRMRHISATS